MSAFDKVIGCEAIKSELIRYCDVLKNVKRYKALGVDTPKGALLYGKPGVGKTLMTSCFIEESSLKSYAIRKEKPNGAFVDHIKEVFEKAKADEPAIVLLDDMYYNYIIHIWLTHLRFIYRTHRKELLRCLALRSATMRRSSRKY